MEKRKVLVSGATGNQGGAVVQSLLKDGHDVTGITRNVNSAKSQNLIKQGVKLVSVDFTHKDALASIMQKVDTVFAMTTPFENGMEAEIEQGKTIADAAKKAGVDHFIFNSVGDANKSTGIPHFDSKFEVEKYIETLDMNYTIVGPAYFMDNIFFPFMTDSLKEGSLKMPMPGNRVLQQISVKDIGKFIAIVVNGREEYFGKRINISGDSISGEEAAAVLSKILNKEITYEGYSPDFMREQSEDMALMYDWFIGHGYSADINSLKQYEFDTFEQWAVKQDWSVVNN